jgi:two-component system, LytTR family, response regulator LytT
MKKPFHILLVEDELMIAEMAKEMLVELGYSVMGIAKNYDRAIEILELGEHIDLVILDINLNQKKSGIDLAGVLKDVYKIPFIFVTSYSDGETVRLAASTEPLAYLIKPFTKVDLFATIEIIKIKKNQSTRSIMVRQNDLSVKVEVRDILFVKSEGNYIEMVTSQKRYVDRNSLEAFLEEIHDDNFLRVHRSYIINLTRVDAVNGRYVVIGQHKIPLSRKHRQEMMDLFSSSR